MIKKEWEVPIKLVKLEALDRRISSTHPKKAIINEELMKRRAGYNGEKSVDYHLSFLEDKKYHILHDLRLENIRGQHFQIDTFLSTPKFITIIDVKNISGTILFDHHFHQLIQKNGDIERAYQDPISQVKRHQLQLKEWLNHYKFPDIPILPRVVISNSSTIIKEIGNSKDSQMITKAVHINFEISNFDKIYTKEKLTVKEWTKLSKLLIKKHTPEEYNVLENFNIHKNEILTGVHCPNCSTIPMERIYGKWLCPSCHYISRTAHMSALRDYALIIGTSITNQGIRQFLHLPSKNIVNNIAKSMNLPHTGVGKARIYHLQQLL